MFEDLTDAVIYEAVNGRFNLDLGSLGFLQSLIRAGNKLGQDGGRISAITSITIGLRVWAATMDLERRGRGGLCGCGCNNNARDRVSYQRERENSRAAIKSLMEEASNQLWQKIGS